MKSFVIGDVHGRRSQLRWLLEALPRDPQRDVLVLLGDLIDRGEDSPGVIGDIIEFQGQAPTRVVALRGNHEQMLLDFIEHGDATWLAKGIGSDRTFEQYTGHKLSAVEDARRLLCEKMPLDHLEFLRSLPLYHEDDYAIYVHAGLDHGKHPRETDSRTLLWSRDADFFKHYRGKTCVFGHTPTSLLPLLGRLGRHGIYVFNSAIGIDTAYNSEAPLSCLSLPDFTLYQVSPRGKREVHHLRHSFADALRSILGGFASDV
ncbi:MAG: hypothetical protein C4334_10135 [Pyrinomonas sp.]|uniref:metallophosphoesterase n=1 Tax=Pyrinomonas sp. TaxID=2080306 RepID=UPI003327C9A7